MLESNIGLGDSGSSQNKVKSPCISKLSEPNVLTILSLVLSLNEDNSPKESWWVSDTMQPKMIKRYVLFLKRSWKLLLDLVQTDIALRTCSWQWQKWYKSLKYSIIYYITGGYHRPNQILRRLSIKTCIYLGAHQFLLSSTAGLCQIYWNHSF